MLGRPRRCVWKLFCGSCGVSGRNVNIVASNILYMPVVSIRHRSIDRLQPLSTEFWARSHLMHSSDDFICTMTFAALPAQRQCISVSNRLKNIYPIFSCLRFSPYRTPASAPLLHLSSCKYTNAHPPVNHQFGAWFLNCQPCSSSAPPSQASWFGIYFGPTITYVHA